MYPASPQENFRHLNAAAQPGIMADSSPPKKKEMFHVYNFYDK